jgi:hypothetical protein
MKLHDSIYDPSRITGIKVIALRSLLAFTIVTVLAAAIAQHRAEYFGSGHEAYAASSYAHDTDDIPPLLLRITECTTLLQTRSYWHEDYTPGITFYRPLSLTWFWFEAHILGLQHFGQWDIISIALHFAFCILLTIFVKDITQSNTAALLTTIVFAAIRPFPAHCDLISICDIASNTPALVAVSSWKDQPTVISDLLTLGALMLVRKQRWALALIAALAAVLFKESGLIAFPMIFLFAAYRGELRRVPKTCFAIAAVFIVIPFAARYLSGMGAFVPHAGQNVTGMTTRLLQTIVGIYFSGFLHKRWAATLFATGIYWIACRKFRSPLSYLLVFLGLATAAGAANSLALGGTVICGIETLFDPQLQLLYIWVCFCYFAAAAATVKYPELFKAALLSAALSVLAALPDVAVHSPPNEHRMHLCFAFQSAVIGICAAGLLRSFLTATSKYYAIMIRRAGHLNDLA